MGANGFAAAVSYWAAKGCNIPNKSITARYSCAKRTGAVFYSAAKNMLFLKPRKVAGTSFEIALSVTASAQDIITPISLDDELIRIDQKGQLPVNWSRQPELEASYVSLVQQIHRMRRAGVVSDELKQKRKQLKDLLHIKGHRLYYNHIVPDEIKQNFTEEKFDNAIKVTITRHPYEQLISQAYWLHQGKQRRALPISQIIDELLAEPAPNTPYYFANDKKLCDIYIKMESFQADVINLENQLGLKIWQYMPMTKKSSTGSRPKAKDILTHEQKLKVQQRSKLEFEHFYYDPN